MTLEIIILAAGQGKRMRSTLPKVLHNIGGQPMLLHLIESVLRLKPKKIHVVVGHGKDLVVDTLSEIMTDWPRSLASKINWVEQNEQKGTGHAALLALAEVKARSRVVVLNGDVPLVRPSTLRKVARGNRNLNLMTVENDLPAGLGRILRDGKGRICGIVEEKDANAAQKQIIEVNTNCLGSDASMLKKWLSEVKSNNTQGEYYLTDIIARAVNDGVPIKGISPSDISESFGVNSRTELARLERVFQRRRAQEIMSKGVTLLDPERFDVRGTCQFGNDCIVDINVILEGEVKIGNHVSIGSNCVIRNSKIGDECVIEANCVIDNARVGKSCRIGPFARIRPQTHLKDGARIGNFVETKNSVIGQGSKINHLSYVGDSDLGRDVNIGAGVITCNYDGANKHRTEIGDDVFVGSDSQLVAPVKIADGATIGAGSTITSDVQRDALAVSRAKQRTVRNWVRPSKK